MTLPHERTRAVELAGEFLTDLLDPKKTPRVPRAIRDRALRILRHYPRSIEHKLDEANQLMHAENGVITPQFDEADHANPEKEGQ